jgi:ribosomal protein S18 acetylase RimI-like enzyme
VTAVRGLASSDAPACDAIVAGLPYHFGSADGRRMCADAVRSQPGLVATLDGDVAGFLTLARPYPSSAEITWLAVRADVRRRGVGRALVDRAALDVAAEGRRLLLAFTVSAVGDEDGPPDGYAATRAFYRGAGFVEARDVPELWAGDRAMLVVRPLCP